MQSRTGMNQRTTTRIPEAALSAARSLADAHDTETLAAALFHAMLTEQRIPGDRRAALRGELARLVNELRDAPPRGPRY